MMQLRPEDTRAAMNGDLKYPKHKTSNFERSPLYHSIRIWNNTPHEMRNEDQAKFKVNLQRTKTENYLKM